MGDAATAVAVGPFGVLYNPAGPALTPRLEAGLSYLRPFGLRELATTTVAVVVPGRRAAWGALWGGFGSDLYREHRFQVTGAWRPVSRLALGAGVKHLRVEQRRYGSAGVFALDLGLLAELHETLRIGTVVQNVNHPRLKRSTTRATRAFRAGVAYRPDATVTLALDVLKETRYAAAARFGVELRLHPALALRAGARADPSVVSGGFGLRLSRWRIDYALENHAALGATHQLSVAIIR